jgi:hypothetical protein
LRARAGCETIEMGFENISIRLCGAPGVAMRDERAQEIRTTFRDRFSIAKNAEWMSSYLAAVTQAQAVSEQQFRTLEFQRSLWEVDGVAGIGPGSSVVVTGAYRDPEIVEALWQLRILKPPEDALDRARALDAEFNRILELVSPRHNARRPSARLARIFAVLRSDDVLCLLDGARTRHFREWLEQPSFKLGFIGQHVISRQALREVLGPESTLEDNVSYSLFSWFVWDHTLTPADPDAVVPPSVSESRATDTPRLTILPAKAQRKGINTSRIGSCCDIVKSVFSDWTQL